MSSNKGYTGAASNTSNTPIQTQFNLIIISPIPGNVKQITTIVELISLFWYQLLDLPKLTLLYKTFKAIRLAMANKMVLNYTNMELLAVNIWKKRPVQQTEIVYNSQGACVLSLKNVEKNRQLAENKEKDREVKQLAQKEK